MAGAGRGGAGFWEGGDRHAAAPAGGGSRGRQRPPGQCSVTGRCDTAEWGGAAVLRSMVQRPTLGQVQG
ncbi:hypothetical protein E2C01_084667 [Portunus trituberculatus]|uniref:Uncharacterized protein n=1 Tax=Portunus trituberculatus TaxID=210409 RepID=A0A5B7IYW7_PORTR|nr:hypothetical protein [Portunus trituberculatus]